MIWKEDNIHPSMFPDNNISLSFDFNFNYIVEMEERRKKVGKIVSADVSKPKGKVGKIVSAEILRRSEEENGGKSKGQIESA